MHLLLPALTRLFKVGTMVPTPVRKAVLESSSRLFHRMKARSCPAVPRGSLPHCSVLPVCMWPRLHQPFKNWHCAAPPRANRPPVVPPTPRAPAQLESHASAVIHPLARVLEGPELELRCAAADALTSVAISLGPEGFLLFLPTVRKAFAAARVPHKDFETVAQMMVEQSRRREATPWPPLEGLPPRPEPQPEPTEEEDSQARAPAPHPLGPLIRLDWTTYGGERKREAARTANSSTLVRERARACESQRGRERCEG